MPLIGEVYAKGLTISQLQDVISNSFEVNVDEDVKVLPGILSRKKQIVPALKLPA